ncbi:LLM class flavin-dependent oxidoreductase [Streptomyces sp. NPDC046805]|uniref:LLM class flavin-dependent oxidoreductase n=1 Tax=Streptomyces sp. NPDC046805 TaxID=3155134 RepID=UPI0033DAD822
MPDYGHDLRFGSFITPHAGRPETVVELAELSERAGLDLATFQDHPYQPGFLDTWTLISYVAARTERIHLSGNVLNLPLRRPAVLARSLASLDLLTGGRIELGLGAGAFFEAIQAMGGRNLAPGERVQALSEAIDVMRGIWDSDNRTPLRVHGDFHPVDGAKRGPAPAHDIPVWLGAYKPRMLRLTGTKADGWLPSLGYATLEDLTKGNRIIDEAAREAGRDPREIRRLLNFMTTRDLRGTPEQWADQLLPLVLEDGFSLFILGGDDPNALLGFAQETAPALREAVAKERRAAGTTTGPVRPEAALALREPRIAYDDVPASLAMDAVEPGDRGYDRIRSSYVWSGTPGLVLRPATAGQVSEALLFAERQDVPLAIRSGGHGISGHSTNDGGILIDLGRLDGVEIIDRARRLVRVGAGALWGDVAAALAPHGLAISSGDYGDVGVGGLATTGGVGFLSRSYGLTIDHVTGAEVVLADGRIVRADAEHESDLFWALRGAGANMGVVTSFDIEAAEIGDVVWVVIVHDAPDTREFLRNWGRLQEESPRELTAFLSVHSSPGNGPLFSQSLIMWANDDTEAAAKAIRPFLNLTPVVQQQAQLVPYAAVLAPHHNAHHGQALHHSRSALVAHLDDTTVDMVADLFTRGHIRTMQIRSVGGAVADIDPAATAFAHRDRNFAISVVEGSPRRAEVAAAWEGLGSDALYLSFESHPDAHALEHAFPPATLARLRRVKAQYDPRNIFRHNFPIEPAPQA